MMQPQGLELEVTLGGGGQGALGWRGAVCSLGFKPRASHPAAKTLSAPSLELQTPFSMRGPTSRDQETQRHLHSFCRWHVAKLSQEVVSGEGRVASLGSPLTAPSKHWAHLSPPSTEAVSPTVCLAGGRGAEAHSGAWLRGDTGDLGELPLLPWHPLPQRLGPEAGKQPVLREQRTIPRQPPTGRDSAFPLPPAPQPWLSEDSDNAQTLAGGWRGRLAPGLRAGERAAETDQAPCPCAHCAPLRPPPRAQSLGRHRGKALHSLQDPSGQCPSPVVHGGRTHFWVTGMLREAE